MNRIIGYMVGIVLVCSAMDICAKKSLKRQRKQSSASQQLPQSEELKDNSIQEKSGPLDIENGLVEREDHSTCIHKKSRRPAVPVPLPYERCVPAVAKEPEGEQISFCIIIPSRNNVKYARKNLESVALQRLNHQNFTIIYIDDQSMDGTSDLVEELVDEFGLRPITTIIHNTVRQGALKNIWNAVWAVDDKTVIVLMDGDDWFAHGDVLYDLNALYLHNDIVLTYGQFAEFPTGNSGWLIQMPHDIVARSAFREFTPHPSHLRTFYAWLFKLIAQEDLLDSEGNFYPMTWDQAIMFPMCEMAGERIRFIDHITYVYNIENPINDNKVNADLQCRLEAEIRAKHRYERLGTFPVNGSLDLYATSTERLM